MKAAYGGGVAMGGDLPPAKSKAPTFVVWAMKDPTAGNLDRIQIVKGWTTSGQSFEKIFDVVWAGNRKPDKWTGAIPPIQSTVDVDHATYTNTVGAVELKKVWVDPEFDPSLHAFYYARVLEIPTPRWSTIQAKQLGMAPPDVVPATVQERAWSSPIWYTPSAEARKNAKPGTTVADLTGKGATALGDDQLKAGVGFAGAVTSAGLPRSELPVALLSFNVGVEIGQVAFVSLVVLLERSFRQLEICWPRWVSALPGYAVGSLGAFWTIQRTAILFGLGR